MKISATVVEVSDNGSTIQVKAQTEVKWLVRSMTVSFEVPTSRTSQTTYRLGREVEIEIRPH